MIQAANDDYGVVRVLMQLDAKQLRYRYPERRINARDKA